MVVSRDNASGTPTDIKQYINSVRDAGGANRLTTQVWETRASGR